MRRLFSMGGLILACLALVGPGCGNDPFTPPRRAKATAAAGAGESKPNFLVMVVPGYPSPEVQEWGLRAQAESNDKLAIFRVMGPPPDKPDAEQPEVVRKAVAEGASALLVCPGGSPELAKSLAEAEAKGVPVILLGKGVAAPEGVKPFTVIEYGAFDEWAALIVAATREDLKKNNRPVDGTAVILSNKVVDPTSTRRVAALKAAAEAAKFAKVLVVEFDGADPKAALAAALEAIKSNPDLSVMLADGDAALYAAAQVRMEAKGKPIFFVGGFIDFAPGPMSNPPDRESCYIDGRQGDLGVQGVKTALARLKGEAIGERVDRAVRFFRTAGEVASESTGAFPKPQPPTALPAAPAGEAATPSKKDETRP